MSDIQPSNTEVVFIGDNGELFTTSLVIAEQSHNQHASVIRLVRENLDDLNEVGLVRFEIRPRPAGQHGGGDIQVAILDEPASALLMTYLKNTSPVRDFKKRLVAGFYAMRQIIAGRPTQPLTGSELMAAGYVEAMKLLEQRDARIYQLEARVNADAPKVTYVDTYVTDADLLSFSTVASSNGVGEKWLRELLISRDWIYRQSDTRWSEREQRKVTRNRYSEKADKKRYFRRVEEHKAPRFRGSEVMHTLKVTPQGAEAIARLVAKEQAA